MGELAIMVHGDPAEVPACAEHVATHNAGRIITGPTDAPLPRRIRAELVSTGLPVLALNTSCRVTAPLVLDADALTVFSVLPSVLSVPWAPEIERATLRDGVFIQGVGLFVHDAPSLALLDWWDELLAIDPSSLAVRRILDLAPGTFGARICRSWRSFMKLRPAAG